MRTALIPLRVLLFGILALLAAAIPANADEAEDKAALDSLFAALRVAPDAASAAAIDRRIWTYWTVPSNPALALRMQQVLAARQLAQIQVALDLCDRIISDYPTYAEGWNQRATLYYLIGDFEHSLADIDKVLEFEPRHFGALSGRVMIYLQQGKRALALRDMATALEIHPFISGRELFPELAREMTRI